MEKKLVLSEKPTRKAVVTESKQSILLLLYEHEFKMYFVKPITLQIFSK